MGNQNIPTQFFDTTIATGRAAEVPFASFSNGVNPGGSCAGAIGPCTGELNPKEQDFERVVGGRELLKSSYIGLESAEFNDFVTLWRDGGLNTNDNVGFGFNTQGIDVIPGNVFDGTLVLVNETGEDIPEEDTNFAWGAQVITESAADGDILTDGVAIGVIPATFYNPINITLNRDWSTGTVQVSLNGVTDDGAYALVSEVIAGPTRGEAAQQIADLINAEDGVFATAISSRVLIQPINTETTPDNKNGDITLLAYTVVQP